MWMSCFFGCGKPFWLRLLSTTPRWPLLVLPWAVAVEFPCVNCWGNFPALLYYGVAGLWMAVIGVRHVKVRCFGCVDVRPRFAVCSPSSSLFHRAIFLRQHGCSVGCMRLLLLMTPSIVLHASPPVFRSHLSYQMAFDLISIYLMACRQKSAWAAISNEFKSVHFIVRLCMFCDIVCLHTLGAQVSLLRRRFMCYQMVKLCCLRKPSPIFWQIESISYCKKKIGGV